MSETKKRKITKIKVIISDQDGVVLDQLDSGDYDLKKDLQSFVEDIEDSIHSEVNNSGADYVFMKPASVNSSDPD